MLVSDIIAVIEFVAAVATLIMFADYLIGQFHDKRKK